VELSEKAKSKAQQRFFGMVRAAQKGEGAASPEVAKVAGEISKKDAKDFAKTKHKGLPEKKKIKEGLSVKDAKKLNKAAALDQSNDPKDQDRARARRTEVDYKDLLRQINKRKKPMKPALESFEIDKSAHKKAQKKSKMRNLAKGNTNPNEKAAAEKKAGGPKLYGEGVGDAVKKGLKRHKDAVEKKKIKNRKAVPYAALAAEYQPEGEMIEGKTFDAWKKAASSALKRKKEERKAQPATDAGARARRKLKDKEQSKYVNFLPAEDD